MHKTTMPTLSCMHHGYTTLLRLLSINHVSSCLCSTYSVQASPYNVGSGRLYSSEEEEHSQREGNAQVQVDKVVKFLNQLFSEKCTHGQLKIGVRDYCQSLLKHIFGLTSVLKRI